MPTKQETFDTVVRGMVKQGCKAMDEHDKQCVYLNERGHRCAAGQVVPEGQKVPSTHNISTAVIDEVTNG